MKRSGSFNVLFAVLGGILVLFIILPLIVTILSSSPLELWYSLVDPEVFQSMILTFMGGLAATGIALATGVPLAYLLARNQFVGKKTIEAIINLPVIIPHTAAGISLLMVFGRRGVLGRPFASLGMSFTDNFAGIVVAMLFVSLPFLVNGAREAFAMTDQELEQVAYLDGASPWQAFWYVTLPQSWRGIAGGAVMMWARGISEFGAIAIIAYHPKVMPILVYERFTGWGLSQTQPMTVLLILSALVLFILFRVVVSSQKP